MRREDRRVRRLLLTTLALTVLVAMTGTALAANPGTATTTTGQELTVEISLDPAPGGAIWLGDPLGASAMATLGAGEFVNVVYVLDVSGSMENTTANPPQDLGPPPGLDPADDCNGDGLAGSALDAACFGLIALNESLGANPNIDVGMVAFGDGAKTADMGPAAGPQPFTSPPDVDADMSTVPDVEQVIRSTDTMFAVPYAAGIGMFTSDITDGFASSTDYDAALTAMNNAFATQPVGEVNRAVFISDGEPSAFSSGAGSPLEAIAPETVVDTYAIGFVSMTACDPGQPLRVIADSTGGTCTPVADPSSLTSLLPFAFTNLAQVDLALNGSLIGTTIGSEPMVMEVPEVDITGLLIPGSNLIEAVATTEDATSALADLTVEVVDMTLTPPTAVNELGSDNEHTVVATLLGSPSVIAGQTVTFEVTGQNPVAPTAVVTDTMGAAVFSYSVPVEPESLGLDSISATATIGGVPKTLFATKEWTDTTAPGAACLETTNPSGKNTPGAPGNGGQGQNQDGFYELTGDDDVFGVAGLEVFLVDTGSGTVFGPFEVGTKVKYTEAGGTTPRYKAMGGNNGKGGNGAAVDYHIWGNGDGAVMVIDGSGNVSDPAACLVPRPPK